ncbi:MAG: TetR/AcrR family transcriptional regulator [Halioglobus sp.]|nr:TetR/AcrR family transcriptional regulator [Halioglobus sp.]
MESAAQQSRRKRPGMAEQRKRIRAAAVDLLSVHGSNGVSVSDICKRARVSRDTYYRCFTDKDALIDELYQTSVNDHIETVLNAWDLDYNNQEWLHRVFDQTIDAILEQHKVAQLLFVESADPNSHAYRVIHKAFDKAARRMQRWCKASYGMSPSKEYLVALLVAVQWLVHNAITSGMKKRDIDKAKAASEQLFHAAFSNLKNAT